jgi:hypothetical protein
MKVITKASEGTLTTEYTYGPVVGSPTSGDGAAVTFRELQRPASAETGPALELQNVTAWCGSNWEAAAPTAAAALARSSSQPWTEVPAPASIGGRREAGSGPSSPLSLSAASGDQETTADGVSSTEDGADEKSGGWVRPLAVAGGCRTLLSEHFSYPATLCPVQ